MMYLALIFSICMAAGEDFVDVLSPAVENRVMNLDQYKDKLKKDLILESMDTQDEGKPDTFIIYKMVDSNKVLQMHLFDLNRDGKIEIVKHFEEGKLVRTESILDKNGFIFAITDYDKESGFETRKVTFDRQIMTTRLSFKNELRREEVDRNLDGKVDMWIHYRGGKVLKTEIDENFDGKDIKVLPGKK